MRAIALHKSQLSLYIISMSPKRCLVIRLSTIYVYISPLLVRFVEIAVYIRPTLSRYAKTVPFDSYC